MRKKLIKFGVLIGVITIGLGAYPVLAITYGTGDYGECPYSVVSTQCDISISNNGFTLNMNIQPSASGSCTIQPDTVTVSTYDPAGYTLTLANESTSTGLLDTNGTSHSIPAASGSLSSPASLSDAWGYRVDGLGSFGSGPTSAVTNGSASSLSFAKVVAGNATADNISQTSSLNTSVNTKVWYGICMDYGLAVPTNTYNSIVEYTATAN